MNNVEVLLLVFSRLDGRDLALACCCCNLWRDVGSNEHLWRSLCRARWPGCEKVVWRKVIQSMGGFRIFFSRRASTMSRPAKQLRPKPWLSLDHLTFFVDLSYKGTSIISEALPGSSFGQVLCYDLRIDPIVITDAILPRQALTPLFYQGQLYYEKPFQATHASQYWLSWSVVRSTDNKMACLLHAAPLPDEELPWEQEGNDDQANDCALALLFKEEFISVGREASLLKESEIMTFAWLDCGPLWGESLSHPMQFRLVQLQLRILKINERSAPPLDSVLLAMQQLDWK